MEIKTQLFLKWSHFVVLFSYSRIIQNEVKNIPAIKTNTHTLIVNIVVFSVPNLKSIRDLKFFWAIFVC